jgi:hypothetical protein
MNIQKLRNVIKHLPSVNDITHGNEFKFTQDIKRLLPSTNFELLGEQLVVGKEKNIGKCDLWLANIPNNFLLSLELKVGNAHDSRKQLFLQTQMRKYTDLMRFYFPEDVVYGLSAYKCTNNDIKFSSYIMPISVDLIEIESLKATIKENCLDN